MEGKILSRRPPMDQEGQCLDRGGYVRIVYTSGARVSQHASPRGPM